MLVADHIESATAVSADELRLFLALQIERAWDRNQRKLEQPMKPEKRG